ALLLHAFLLCIFVPSNLLSQEFGKINGVSFVGGANEVTTSHMEPIEDLESNFLALMPFAYGNTGQASLSFHDLDWQYWGENIGGVKTTAILAKQRGIECMIKPHVWLDRGSFTGHFELKTEEEWKTFEADYTNYILPFAMLSEELNLPMFCIGTELCKFTELRPNYWLNLIKEIRKVYSGKLTYAANWDSYQKMGFWNQLDYIGIDAYFPLCDMQTPSVKDCQKAWEKHSKTLRSYSRSFNKQILFTEWGYRSADYCAREPWNYDDDFAFNAEAQANCIAATFNQFWMEDWFAGGFIWKWFPNHKNSGKGKNNNFTPQNKPAQEVIKEWFNATNSDD
ncbi:MAG: glycoside hydrolase family 113, partial [Flavobacteriales bacterium]